MTTARSAPTAAVMVVGIGVDGCDGLPNASRRALLDMEVVVGGSLQLDLLPPECAAERTSWPSPLRPAVLGLLAVHAGRRIAVLASGDPMLYGIGRTLTEVLGPDAVHVLPHPSPVPCLRPPRLSRGGRPGRHSRRPASPACLAAALHDGGRLLVLSADAGTPGEIAALLRDQGFGPSRMRVLEQLGGVKE